ncbi:hypothetical protein AtubIFM55763_003599 [Aspergillus tubingensis]|uniref:Rhodopsin domain-containing protein n=3 Tax=Aspergillus subgen. Circumdati TaxID=2720871 RepID=A0A1L9N0F7_ASPTC|nr:uncharacterized protein AtWU_06638 [Aspergillus tubingensis]OJI82784.1 hypothetical protein ASPTUDRAFT_202126 [Aspergillus tubingensis CBS 134.48]GAQ42207.1 hypothetical protein AKAW_02015 [Aspergillus niger]GFN16836.1 integral membrane protein [Aspergillus tubingensis]GLA62286.1 hypothetical protein AtubIFM54640_002832 [Aspergillus tubingensis]GLA72714.1 hypothetical protein AtubIFM55763_003599 [Aspergillus tubingensis]
MSSLTAAQIEAMEANPGATRAPGIIACASITMAASAAGVILRVIARSITSMRLGLDDYFIIVGLFFNVAFSVSIYITIHYGMGKHIVYVTDAKGLTLSITIAECFYCLAICFTKLSILTFYGRIFPQRWFRLMTWFMAFVVVAYNFCSVLATWLQCVPLSHAWDPSVPATCIDYYAVVVFSGVTNVVTDFIILSMPLSVIHQLHMSSRKKRMLASVFALGFGTCIASILRCIEAQALNSTDSSWDLQGAIDCTSVEICVAMITACMPSMRPLVSKIFKSNATQANSKMDPTVGTYKMSTQKGTRSRADRGWSAIDHEETQRLPEERSADELSLGSLKQAYRADVRQAV